jgi:hypothetical protein
VLTRDRKDPEHQHLCIYITTLLCMPLVGIFTTTTTVVKWYVTWICELAAHHQVYTQCSRAQMHNQQQGAISSATMKTMQTPTAKMQQQPQAVFSHTRCVSLPGALESDVSAALYMYNCAANPVQQRS